MLQKCRQETNLVLSLPLDKDGILTFIGWLLNRGLSSSTIETYLGSLRQLYLQEGLDPSSIRSELVRQIIRGRKNETLSVKTIGENKHRLPVTPTILKLLKIFIKEQNFKKGKKLLLWTVCTSSFFGSFRIHEILCRNNRSFDPLCCLLSRDLTLVNTTINNKELAVLQFQLKQEKTSNNPTPTIIDLVESGGPLCPVSAYKKWKQHSLLSDPSLPAFRTEDGLQFTGANFNSFLRAFNQEKLPNTPGKITSHSFRAGLPSVLGSLGYSDKDIQTTGRWTSRAFLAYTKLPR